MENGSSNGPPMRGGFRGRGGNEFLIKCTEYYRTVKIEAN